MPELSAGKGSAPDARRRTPSRADSPIEIEEAKRLLLPFIEGRTVLLGVSGGPDSVALMRLSAAIVRSVNSPRPFVATVDHGLRCGSHAEAVRVGLWARESDLAHAILPWEGRKPITGIQEKARAARYALLAAQARQLAVSVLVTAHTLDDQAETVLMRLCHGSGFAGLAGMRSLSERDGLTHARPLLGISKARLVATCKANRWPFIEDPTNADPRFARARWRELATLLAKEGLTASRLAKLAARAGAVEEALEAKAAEAFALTRIDYGRKMALDIALLLRREPREIAVRVFLRALDEMREREPPTPIRLQRVEAAVETFCRAVTEQRALRHSLAGMVLTYDGKGTLTLDREDVRRRGRRLKLCNFEDASGAKQHRTELPHESG